VSVTDFGAQVSACGMKNANGMTVRILSYGGVIQSIEVPDRNGRTADVVLGAGSGETCRACACNAAVIGRVANRIGNGRFSLGGKETVLDANEGTTTLHGASGNYGQRDFTVLEHTDSLVRLGLREEGEGGFPGGASVVVTYTLSEDNTLSVEYEVTPEETTPVNVTNHAYFNLAGHASGTVDDQVLQLEADLYTPADRKDIPTGEILSVKGTPFDFRRGARLGDAMADLELFGDWHGGFDHNLVLRGRGFRQAGAASDPASGRKMTLFTDLPGVQLFTANFFGKMRIEGKGGVRYPLHAGFCLETQYFPDSVNKPHFPDCIVRAGETFRTKTAFRFGAGA